MPFNVDEFRASIALRGVLKTNKFMVTFVLPPCFNGSPFLSYYQSLSLDSGLWCDSASIPGVVLQTLKFRRYGIGPLDSAVVAANFNDVQLRFIADSNGDNWRMFAAWIDKSLNFNDSGGMWNENAGISNNQPMAAYETGFQVDFQTTLFVSVYNDVGNEVKTIALNQANPTAISDIKLDWGDGGDAARFMVNFSIQDWYSTGPTSTVGGIQNAAQGS